MRIAILFAVPLGLLTTGCTPIDTGLGEAVRHDLALQTLDPDPQYEGTVMEGGSGARAGLAQKRYREGTVFQPVRVTTSSNSIGGGSGSGSSGLTSGSGGGSSN